MFSLSWTCYYGRSLLISAAISLKPILIVLFLYVILWSFPDEPEIGSASTLAGRCHHCRQVLNRTAFLWNKTEAVTRLVSCNSAVRALICRPGQYSLSASIILSKISSCQLVILEIMRWASTRLVHYKLWHCSFKYRFPLGIYWYLSLNNYYFLLLRVQCAFFVFLYDFWLLQSITVTVIFIDRLENK